MTRPHIALLGLGLIGSSLGHALKRGALSARITGYAPHKETRDKALEIGFVDEVAKSASIAVRDADIIFLNMPIGAMGDVMAEIAPHIKAGAIVTDVGSVKQAVIDVLWPLMPKGVHFIPAHPIAGTEESGPEAGFADLFDNRWCIITPLPDTDKQAVAQLIALWEAMGAQVETMLPAHHDMVLAVTSHVPHLIAYNLVGTAAALDEVAQGEVIKYSAGGFRDFTRIAASDPIMWRDVFLNNRAAVLDVLAQFMADLETLEQAVRTEDGAMLENLFSRTRLLRRDIIKAGQEISAVDFGRQKKK